MHQCLVDDRVVIVKKFHLLGHAAANVEVYSTVELQEQWGFKPEQWIDYQTLAGDSGDGVPGCSGWGEKTAKEAIQKYGSVAAIYDHIDELRVSEKRKLALIEFRERGWPLMRTLVTLRTDVEAVNRLFVSRRRIGAN
jgi:DNA polymerase-1